MIWLNGDCYLSSNTFRYVEKFKIDQGKFLYLKTLCPQLVFEGNFEARRYQLTTDGTTIFVAEKATGTIYLMEP